MTWASVAEQLVVTDGSLRVPPLNRSVEPSAEYTEIMSNVGYAAFEE
jgi:hypothetical protein